MVRDCVGYQSVGHGFFLEDGTEVFNLLPSESLSELVGPIAANEHGRIARLITLAENCDEETFRSALAKCRSTEADRKAPVVGLTGTGGAGKSSLLDELMLRIIRDEPDLRVAFLCTDPTRKRTGGHCSATEFE